MENIKKEKAFQEWSLTVLGKASENFPEHGTVKKVYEIAFEGCRLGISAKTARKYLLSPTKMWKERHHNQEGLEKIEKNIADLYAGCLYSEQLKLACETLNQRVQGWNLGYKEKEVIDAAYSQEERGAMIHYLAYILWTIIQ